MCTAYPEDPPSFLSAVRTVEYKVWTLHVGVRDRPPSISWHAHTGNLPRHTGLQSTTVGLHPATKANVVKALEKAARGKPKLISNLRKIQRIYGHLYTILRSDVTRDYNTIIVTKYYQTWSMHELCMVCAQSGAETGEAETGERGCAGQGPCGAMQCVRMAGLYELKGVVNH